MRPIVLLILGDNVRRSVCVVFIGQRVKRQRLTLWAQVLHDGGAKASSNVVSWMPKSTA